MANKSKLKRLREIKKNEAATLAVLVGLSSGILAIIQNNHGQLSDLTGFYGMHFADGLHQWPYSTNKVSGSGEPIHAVEYPALTGLVMWVFSFFVKPGPFSAVDYFRITASVQVVVFVVSIYYIQKLSNRKLALIFAVSPAVLYSLNRNWDIWAVATMLIALYLFHKGKETQSAVWLAISIAIKFFPFVALLPIAIYYLRNRRVRDGIKYAAITFGAWLAINAPFMLINFRGWSYFYEFSYKREVGSASIFEVTSTLGFGLPSTKAAFYAFNLIALGLVALYLLKSKKVIGVAEGTFFTMFAFILFNKQYSMQYVIWLAALAVLPIYFLSKKSQEKIIALYAIWQASELLFQYSFFQKILTSAYKGTETPASPEISDGFYGGAGIVRYSLALIFTFALAHYLTKERKAESEALASRSSQR